MKRSKSIVIFVSCMIAFTVSFLPAQPDKIIINNKTAFIHKQRSPVAFPHGVHMNSGTPCKDCHHQYRDGDNVLDESELVEGNSKIKCASCHTKVKTGGKDEVSGSRYALMDAYHLQCMGCHGTLEKKGMKSGPRLCGQCHPRM